MLVGINWRDVPKVWEVCRPLVQMAIDRGQHDWHVDDVNEHLLLRNMQLWAWVEEEKIVACCVTQIVNYPRRKVCQLQFVAGKSMKHWLNTDTQIAAWAKEEGCTHLEAFCRDGWIKVLKPSNWRKIWVTMRKEI